jgi:hypothetical protein
MPQASTEMKRTHIKSRYFFNMSRTSPRMGTSEPDYGIANFHSGVALPLQHVSSPDKTPLAKESVPLHS